MFRSCVFPVTLHVASVFLCCFGCVTGSVADELSDWTNDSLPGLMELYQHFHSHPELSYYEKDTAARLAAELRSSGFDVTTEVGGYGVVGLLKNGDGPTVMFRTDLDALPVIEETGLAFASKVTTKDDSGNTVGVMHACGHDIHMTNVIAVARYLGSHRQEWRGTLMLIGQPAEERVGGAVKMLKAGLYEKFPKPQFALALHCDAELEAGKVGFRSGYAMANSETCNIVMKGRGGHGSKPEACIDPIIQAAQLIVDIQSIVGREVPPLEPAVITVGAIQGGTKSNIIPDSCTLKLTLRSYSPEVRQLLRDALTRKARAIAQSHRAPEPEVSFDDGTSAVFNDEGLTARVVGGFVSQLGESNVVSADRVMGAEDFGEFAAGGVPVFMFRLGTVPPAHMAASRKSGAPLPSLHSSKYHPDAETSLRMGLRSSIIAIRELMPPG